MDQFTPEVSDSDVEKPRVILACLKASNGDIQKLKGNLANAAGYYREIIGEAEYPNYMKKAFRIDELSEAEKSTLAPLWSLLGRAC